MWEPKAFYIIKYEVSLERSNALGQANIFQTILDKFLMREIDPNVARFAHPKGYISKQYFIQRIHSQN